MEKNKIRGIIKKVEKTGRFSIPKPYLEHLKIKESVEILLTDEAIIIKKPIEEKE